MTRKILMATITAVPIDEQRSVIWFLVLENSLGSEIHTRMRAVHGA